MTDTFQKTRCLIIGSGPAGYTSSIYTARADLQPILYEGYQPGGQLTITGDVENFPGYPNGISGSGLMQDLKEQAERFNVEIRSGVITEVDFSRRPFTIIDDKRRVIKAETVIIATGATAKWLGLESEKKFSGQGVSACATCDGFFYKNQDVAIVGGGDTACEDATYLSHICNKVYMIVRRDKLRASKIMQKRVMNNPKIEILWNNVVEEILGTDNEGVTGVSLENVQTGEFSTIQVSGLFLAIGHQPNVNIFRGQLDLNDHDYIITKPGTTETNIPGVFAAGDVQDMNFRQAITAAGTGCMAALEAERFLYENDDCGNV